MTVRKPLIAFKLPTTGRGHPRQQKLVEMIPDYEVFLTPLTTRIDREVLDRAKRLKVILSPAVF